MGLINNLKVAYKLLIVAIIAVVGMCFIGYSGYSALQHAQADMDSLYDKSVKGVEYVGQARYGVRYAQGMAVTMTTVRDNPQRAADLVKKCQSGMDDVDASLTDYQKLIGADQEKVSKYNKVADNWQKLKQNLTQVVDLCKAGKYDEGSAVYGATGAAIAASLGTDLGDLIKYETQQAETTITENDEAAGEVIRYIILQIVITLVLLVVVCWYIDRKSVV